MKSSKNFGFKISIAGILTALAIISFMLEGLFPPLFIPGARMGISNVFILLAVLLLGNVYGYAVLIIKIFLGSLFMGNISAILYSLPAGVVSITIEILLISFISKFSILAISMVGGIINITIQNLIFCFITAVTEYLVYLPYLAIIGSVSGLIVGVAVYFVIKLMPNSIIIKLYDK